MGASYFESIFRARAIHRSALSCAASLGSFLHSIGDEWDFHDKLPPMFWDTSTLTNESVAVVEVAGPRISKFTLRPGESITRPAFYMEHLRVLKTTAPGSSTLRYRI